MSGNAALISFPVITIFAREFLEGIIIIAEYRTIILRGDSLAPGITKEEALRDVTNVALLATALAFLVVAAIAIPLGMLGMQFDPSTAKVIEGVSKIVAAISLLLLSLKIPKFLGFYGSKKKTKTPVATGSSPTNDVQSFEVEDAVSEKGKSQVPDSHGGTLTRRSIRFNVAWNIWREVAECGVFLIPFFLSGDLIAIPLSAFIGAIVGSGAGIGFYFANQRIKSKKGLVFFVVLLLIFLSAGLFTGGCHNFEKVFGSTMMVWQLKPEFWSVDRLPMTLIKPFGYNNSRTLLEILCFWGWLGLSALFHYYKYRTSPKPVSIRAEHSPDEYLYDPENNGSVGLSTHLDTQASGNSSFEEEIVPDGETHEDLVLSGNCNRR